MFGGFAALRRGGAVAVVRGRPRRLRASPSCLNQGYAIHAAGGGGGGGAVTRSPGAEPGSVDALWVRRGRPPPPLLKFEQWCNSQQQPDSRWDPRLEPAVNEAARGQASGGGADTFNLSDL